jgi:hypothetical protein
MSALIVFGAKSLNVLERWLYSLNSIFSPRDRWEKVDLRPWWKRASSVLATPLLWNSFLLVDLVRGWYVSTRTFSLAKLSSTLRQAPRPMIRLLVSQMVYLDRAGFLSDFSTTSIACRGTTAQGLRTSVSTSFFQGTIIHEISVNDREDSPSPISFPRSTRPSQSGDLD